MLGFFSLRLVSVPRLNLPCCKHTIMKTPKTAKTMSGLRGECVTGFILTDCIIFLGGGVWRVLTDVDLWGCTRGEVIASGRVVRHDTWLCGRFASLRLEGLSADWKRVYGHGLRVCAVLFHVSGFGFGLVLLYKLTCPHKIMLSLIRILPSHAPITWWI